ncbi:hypothetical protein [Nocardia sp. BMG51109]|uniref:hypothetical protein n=1 Tax=Nocardia sp. BMG51109 TaxID=1056816 RepID=UPI000462F115|nr:hypothetical protein [Nocardia sp. BMG51109]
MPTLRIAGRTDVFGDAWQVALAIGCGSVALGVVVLAWSDKSVRAAGVLFALCLALTAVWQAAMALLARIGAGLRVLEFASAAVAVLLAVLCLQSGDWVSVLALWVGLGWAIRGVVLALAAVWSSGLPHAGRQECYGLLTVLAGFLVAVWPVDPVGPVEAVGVLSGLIGIGLILLGGTEIHTALRLDRSAARSEAVGVHGLLRTESRTG